MACWEFYPGQWTHSFTSMGDSVFVNINEAISNCTALGSDDCGAVLYDGIDSAYLRKETDLHGESNSSISMGSWIRKHNQNRQC